MPTLLSKKHDRPARIVKAVLQSIMAWTALFVWLVPSVLLAQKPPAPVNELVIPAPCEATWVAVLGAIHAPLVLKASDKDAGVLYFVSASRFSDAESNEAVRTWTTARLSKWPGMWSDFGMDALNFSLKPVTDQSCSVHIELAYSARNQLVRGISPLHTNGSFETIFLTQLQDAAKDARTREAADEVRTAKSVPELPAWVPLYPGSKVTLLACSEFLYDGSYEIRTYPDADNAVLAFYTEKLMDADLHITKHREPDYLTAQDKAGNHRISITVVNGSVLVKFSAR
jgi:hypothetical protein